MSADRLSNEIQSDRRPLRLSLWRCLLALAAAVLTVLSVSVSWYMRSFADIGQYYSGELQGLLRASLSIWCLPGALLLFLIYAVVFHLTGRPRLVSVMVALLLAACATAALSATHSDPRAYMLPIGPVGNAAVLLGFAFPIYSAVQTICTLRSRGKRRSQTDAPDAGADPGPAVAEQQGELPDAAEPAFRPGPLLGFVMQFIPVPKKPKTYLDFLKVLAIYLVLWNHTSRGFGLYNNVLEMPQHLLLLCASIFDKIAVPLFFMASGALLLGREESWGQLLRKRVKRFVLILVVVSAISYVMYFRGDADFSFMDFLARLYCGRILTPLWYLYSYIAMLLMLPFLRKLARCMREQDYFWLLGFYTLTQLLSAADYFLFRGAHYHSSDFYLFTSWNYVLFSLFGYYIDRVMLERRMNLETFSVLTMLSVLGIGATVLLTEYKMQILGQWSSDTSQSFFNTFIAFPSIMVFYTAKLRFTRHPVSGRAAAIWSLLATGTFGTYLFERYWRDRAWFVYEALEDSLGQFGSTAVYILAACAFGILATLLYKLVTGILKAVFSGRKFSPRSVIKRKKPELNYTALAEDTSDLEEMETLLVGKHRSQGEPKP